MGSTSYIGKPKSPGYRAKSGSSAGSDKDMNGKLRRPKIRRPTKLSDYGLKRIPDYTELAYKEAVSKLRYFLSGNYAPSIRSYGGSPSIKNLDESEGDLDKKYVTSYPLAEYKPRARLTAKYATLYADSLNNTYGQPNTTGLSGVSMPAPAAVPTPELSTGGANPDMVAFIQKQDEYIEQLEKESQYCRDELNNLLGKVKEVISENENLHEAQKNKIISRMFHSYNGGSETDDLDDFGDSTGLDSDNKMSPSKYRRPRSRSARLEGPNIMFESRISELEAQLTQAQIDLKKVQDENNENKRKLASGLVDSTCLDGFKRQIDNLQRDKTALEAQISKLKLSLDEEGGKYRRGAGDVVEQQLREERNSLEAEIRRLKEELSKERSKIRELAGEGARRAIQERSAAESRYNAHFDELQHDLAVQYDTVAKLQLELERQRREENDLKREISMKNSAVDELRMELKNKTSTLQADLAQAYAEKASLEEELASARLAMERHQRQSKHETNRLNSEIQSLRQRLDRADADLVHSRRENLRLSEQISNLEKELNMKNLTPISPEKKKEKEISSVLESIENKHAKTVAGLESMIHSQNSLMEKLTGECRLLTDKLDDANRRHKEELGTLQRQVETLRRSLPLPTPATTPSIYQAQPTHTAAANRIITSPAPAARPDHTRVDTSGHPADPTVSDLRDSRQPSRQSSRQLSRQSSKASVHDNIFNPSNEPTARNGYPVNESPVVKYPANTTEELKTETVIDEPEKDSEPQYSERYENYDQTYAEPDNNVQYEEQPQYEAQSPEYNQQSESYQQENVEYQNQGYGQNYEQGYTEGQYDNYEQFADTNAQYTDPNAQYTDPNAQFTDPNAQFTDPNAQYTDPNAQYQQQYENYGTEAYQREQTYENTQYNQGLTPEYQNQPQTEVTTDINVPTAGEQVSAVPERKREKAREAVETKKSKGEVPESKRSNSPNDKVTKS